jgi:hypothetical protein
MGLGSSSPSHRCLKVAFLGIAARSLGKAARVGAKQKAIITLTKVPQSVGCVRQAGALKDEIMKAILAELDDYVDPPMTTGLTVPRSDRLWIARRAAERVLALVEHKGTDIC